MPDELDLASERAEIDRENSLRLRKPAGPQPNGRCHFCDEIVSDTARFCGPECRDDWEAEQKRGRR